jgi:hypothetical protein
MIWHKEPCIHCGKDTKKGRFSDRKPIYICDNCYNYHNYGEIEASI